MQTASMLGPGGNTIRNLQNVNSACSTLLAHTSHNYNDIVITGQQQQPDKLPQLDDFEVENISLTTSAIDTGWWKSLPCQTDGRHTTNGLTDSKYDEDGAFARQLGESRAENTAKIVTLPMGGEILPGAKTPPNRTEATDRTGSNEFKSHLPFAKHDLTPDNFEDTFFEKISNLFINNEKRLKRSLYYGLKVGVLPSNFRYKSLDHQSAESQRPRQAQMNRRTERRDRRFQDGGTDRVTHWTNNKEGAYQSTKGADEEATGEPHTPELTAEESASAPIFVTIVQRHKEADYFIDNHHPYHSPPPPPPPPPVYHPEPHYHPHPPLKYHPTPEYYPPPPHPPPPLDYYHYEKESKYYHASDYHEPSYHKPKFVHDIKYVEEHEHYPPPPPPLPLPKHEKGHHYAPPVYHAKSYHETKVQHDYVPPPPPPPKVYHEPVIVHKGHHHKKDYYIPEPEYHHPAPTTYEYSVKIYDRKDDFEPEYYDLPKAYHPGYEEPIKEVKHEYKKGSRSFEHSISKLPPVHIVADDLYDPPPPHGFIKAKYETPASYSPPHHHRYNKDHPLPKTSYHTTHYKDSVPVPPPLPPPPELTEDSYEVPLPAPLPSLEDVDPLIFDPILPYNEYFEDASRIALKRKQKKKKRIHYNKV
ncbi:uncharacterized protein LOC135213317 [Macrobrachium nipponense]|uniref:uncharacterized protein LOC135213317 n=1 Tax=Macrobrachium nipponense TaxID=159736 RepID=UPI0030C7E773